jgi:autotransporter-associated beta strand protein
MLRAVLLASTALTAANVTAITPSNAQQITQGGGDGAGVGSSSNGGSGGIGGGGGGGAGGFGQNGASAASALSGQAGGAVIGTNNVSSGAGGSNGSSGHDGTDHTDSAGNPYLAVTATDPTSGKPSAYQITNDVTDVGDGGNAGANGRGGGGGAAGMVFLGTNVSVDTNGHNVTGGTGDSAPSGGGGGGGGAGLVLGNGGQVHVGSGSIVSGGAGGISDGGSTGFGGAGIFLYQGGSLNIDNGGTIIGGGGDGSVPVTAPNQGSGGGGGAGILANNGTINNSGAILGGYGINSSAAFSLAGAAGSGVEIYGGALTNLASGTIRGGNGGSASTSGLSGNGGAGVVIYSGQSASVTNLGTIAGGSGRSGGDGVVVSAANSTVNNSGTITGSVGVEIDGDSSTVINSGHITTTASNSIVLAGSNDRLELGNGYDFGSGNVVATGAGAALVLGGAANSSFDVSQLSQSTVFRNFASFEKTGTSTWTLLGTPGQVTDWTLTGGELSVADDASLGNSTSSLTFNGGVLKITGTAFQQTTRAITWGSAGGGFDVDDASNVFTVSQGLTGTGGLLKTGAGTLELSGTNDYSGATHIVVGILQSGVSTGLSANSAFTVDSGATLDLHGNNSTIGSLAGGGNVLLGVNALEVGGDNTSTEFSGQITGNATGALSKTGSGTFTVTGNGNSYMGETTVNDGALIVNGSIASSSLTTVNANATLGGSGTVGTTMINGGTLAPGDANGLLTVNGSLTFTAASTYLVQISPSSAGQVAVTGSATLAGASVKAVFASGSYVNKTYTILTAGGGVSGTFSGPVNTTLPANFTSALSYDGNNAYLDITLGMSLPSGGQLNRNQQNVANVIENFFNANGGIPLALGGLTPQGLTQASGETATGAQQTTFDAMNLFMGLMSDPTEHGTTPAPSSPYQAYAEMPTKAFPRFQPAFTPGWSTWASGFGGSQTTDGNSATGSNTVTSRIFGGAAGADYHLAPDTLLGFALMGGGTNFSVANGGTGRSDLFQAGVFGRQNFGAGYVSGALAYGWQDITTDRYVIGSHLRAEFDANTYSGRIEGGYRFALPNLGGVGLTPYAAAQVTVFDLPAYAEQAIGGGVFALNYDSESVTDTRSELGFRADKSFVVGDAILTLRGRAAWAHDFDTDRSVSATFQSLPGASFVVNGAALAPDSALITASAETKWANGWSVAATFDGEFSDVTASYAAKGVVRYAW